jgi:N-methylhydantoinase A
VTDADLLLGYLNPDYFLGGAMALHVAAAEAAIRDHVALPLGVDVQRGAWGIHDIINEQMASAMRIHIAEKGKDPREYTIVATGGAGPLHAYRIAEKLHIRRILCPLAAGVASTIGLLVAPPKVDLVHSRVWRLNEIDWAALNQLYAVLENRARALLEPMGEAGARLTLNRFADMRYLGQGHTIVVPLPLGELNAALQGDMETQFEAVYRQLYGRSLPGVAIEGITWRLTALGRGTALDMAHAHTTVEQAGAAQRGQRSIYLPEVQGYVDVPVYNRYALRAGVQIDGPAILEERESTVVIGQRGRGTIDQAGNLTVILT